MPRHARPYTATRATRTPCVQRTAHAHATLPPLPLCRTNARVQRSVVRGMAYATRAKRGALRMPPAHVAAYTRGMPAPLRRMYAGAYTPHPLPRAMAWWQAGYMPY